MTELSNFIDIQKIITAIVQYIPNVLSAALLLVLFWFGNAIVQKTLNATLSRMKIERQAINLLLRGAKAGVYIFAFLTVADQLQVNIKSLLAGVGVMGLAISFAAKDTVGNIISGVVIIIDQPFREGDWIFINGIHAIVSEIRLRTTVLTTFDNETVVVPNQQMSQERIINYTITPRIRVKVSVGIAYKEDIDKARAVLLKIFENDSRVLTSPTPIVVVTGLDASSVNLQIRFWIQNPEDQFPFFWEYTEKAKKALDKAGIQIPFPHLQLFVEETDGIKLLAAPDNKEKTGSG